MNHTRSFEPPLTLENQIQHCAISLYRTSFATNTTTMSCQYNNPANYSKVEASTPVQVPITVAYRGTISRVSFNMGGSGCKHGWGANLATSFSEVQCDKFRNCGRRREVIFLWPLACSATWTCDQRMRFQVFRVAGMWIKLWCLHHL